MDGPVEVLPDDRGANVSIECASYGICRHPDSFALGTSNDRMRSTEGGYREGKTAIAMDVLWRGRWADVRKDHMSSRSV